MGVVGLTSLIEVNPHLMSDIQLRDTTLVVDGNSFCYQLYNISRIDSRFGGDYSIFEALIITRLDQFDCCGIRPIFVFDGLLDIVNLKRDTALHRQKMRLFTAKSLVSTDSRASLLPLFAQTVLIDILKNRGIEIYQCAGEADAIAVGVANDRRAPLLSQDSDFFIFDVKHGYVPFETVEWRQNRSDTAPLTYISAKLYLLDNLLEHYPSVDRRLLPLFAFLCGNDFSVGFNMAKFFDHIHKPRVDIAGGHKSASSRRRRSTKGVRPMRRHCNMIAVLEWLRGKSDEKTTIEEAIQWIEQKRRDKIRGAIRLSMEAYQRCDFVKNANSIDCDSFDVIQITKQHISHLNLPEWLVNGYVNGEVSVALLQIRQDRRIFLPALIEEFTKPSVYDCCIDLRLAVYHLLLENDSDEARAVTEYSRRGSEFAKRLVLVNDEKCSATSFLSSPDLDSIEKLSAMERRRLFYDFLQFSSCQMETVSRFPGYLALFAATFIFWCHSEATQVRRYEACALLVCTFWLWRSDSINDEKSNFPGLSTVSCGSEKLQTVELEFDYTPSSSNSRKGHLLELAVLHSFSQWQACFQAVSWLDSLLANPFGRTAPIQRLFHGRVAYNLAKYIKFSKSETTALDYLFKDSPSLLRSFNDLWALVQKYLLEQSPSAATPNKSKKNKRRGTKKDPTPDALPLKTDSDNDTALGDSDDEWGLENRFKTLVSLNS